MRFFYTTGVQIGILFMAAVIAMAQQKPPAAKVVVAKIFEKELAPTNQMIGIIDFDKQSGLSTEVSGLIQEHVIREGDIVRKGDVLVRLNTDMLKKDLEIIKNQMEQVDVKIENARKNVARFETLFKESAASEKAYEDLVDSLKELDKEKAILQKNYEKKTLSLVKSRISTPFDGVILERMKNEGEWISPGDSICTIASIADVVVQVAVGETFIRYIKKGLKISLFIPALEKSIEGAVKTIVPVADLASKTFQVKITIPYEDQLIQNMSVTAYIPVNFKMKLKMIKRDALVRNQGKEFVYTIKEGKSHILPVTIAAYEGEFMGVTNPYFVSGMPIVVDGNERLRPGQAVKVVK